MATAKRAAGVVLAVAGVATVVVEIGRSARARRLVRHGVGFVGRRARYARGRLEGLRYRLAGRAPDPWVADDVLADRIRSALGPLEKRLDVPRVHVTVEDHVAVLHGEVPDLPQAQAIEAAVREVPGVRGVRSHLHVGLGSGSTRPSEGRAQAMHAPSGALRELLRAAQDAGVSEASARDAVEAVLSTFAARLPADEREQLFAHVPADVRELAAVPGRPREAVTRLRTVSELVATVAAREGLEPEQAGAVTESVLARLRELVPEEAEDVARVLPEELSRFWRAAVPG